MQKVFGFHSDAGHGWLRVRTSHLKFLGLADKITGYSYLSKDGRTAFLEEDCDATLFMETMKRNGFDVVVKSHNDGDRSPIRGLPRFDSKKCSI